MEVGLSSHPPRAICWGQESRVVCRAGGPGVTVKHRPAAAAAAAVVPGGKERAFSLRDAHRQLDEG